MGEADIAVGVSPRWDGADRCEYSLPYIQHSNRLMIPANKQIEGFSSLLGTGWWVAYFADDSADADEIQKYADGFGVGSNINLFPIQHEDQAIYTMVEEDNISMIYGDSLRLNSVAARIQPARFSQDSRYQLRRRPVDHARLAAQRRRLPPTDRLDIAGYVPGRHLPIAVGRAVRRGRSAQYSALARNQPGRPANHVAFLRGRGIPVAPFTQLSAQFSRIVVLAHSPRRYDAHEPCSDTCAGC